MARCAITEHSIGSFGPCAATDRRCRLVKLDDPVTTLYPPTGRTRPLRNLYLEQPLEPENWDGSLFLYSNFVTSLDGRIALDAPTAGASGVPPHTANPRDWRLFQELAAQAGVLITSGRYLRQFAAGTAQDVLPVGSDEAFADLLAWRRAQNLPPQPDVAVVSASLDFDVPEALVESRQRILVLTSAHAPRDRRQAHEARGCQVVVCDQGATVTGAGIYRALEAAGYRRAYSVTGPQILRLLLADGVLHALFLTQALRMLGGEAYDTLVEGDVLADAPAFELRTLFHDPYAPEAASQLLACYDRR
ncbi:dihydrofolate reductase family protein [Ectothiorhodospiraceae bacterium WFHF3C12]|nr:dihydrofolate reductase family protein [Ectothiorhodospiraceae bacterium WFHF3C12]